MKKTNGAHKLEVTLRFVGHRSGDPQVLGLQVNVHNPTERAITFLDWHTPFEGFANQFMHVVDAQGNEVAYQGMMKSRAAPRKSDYRTVKPGRTDSCSFNLLEAYPLPAAGDYSVQFHGASMNNLRNSNILFVKSDGDDVAVSPITIELHAAAQVIEHAAPVLVDFAVQNTGTEQATLLPWYTPLDPVATDCFEVTGQDGEECPFLLPMIDRTAPQPEDHIDLAAGQRLSSQVDLHPLYEFGTGRHLIRYTGSKFADSRAQLHPLEICCE